MPLRVLLYSALYFLTNTTKHKRHPTTMHHIRPKVFEARNLFHLDNSRAPTVAELAYVLSIDIGACLGYVREMVKEGVLVWVGAWIHSRRSSPVPPIRPHPSMPAWTQRAQVKTHRHATATKEETVVAQTKETYTKVCSWEGCGKTFTTNSKRRINCSDACTNAKSFAKKAAEGIHTSTPAERKRLCGRDGCDNPIEGERHYNQRYCCTACREQQADIRKKLRHAELLEKTNRLKSGASITEAANAVTVRKQRDKDREAERRATNRKGFADLITKQHGGADPKFVAVDPSTEPLHLTRLETASPDPWGVWREQVVELYSAGCLSREKYSALILEITAKRTGHDLESRMLPDSVTPTTEETTT